jgi:ribosome maturation factor RimP
LVAPIREVTEGIEARVEALGLEVVDLEWAGSVPRPIIRLRIDFPEGVPGAGVTVADCVRVSRDLEPWLDEHPRVGERYVLEVSSPGVERPLKRRRDYERFLGREVRIKRSGQGRGGSGGTLTGVLSAVEGREGPGFRVVLELPDGSLARVGDGEILRANLVFRWEEGA